MKSIRILLLLPIVLIASAQVYATAIRIDSEAEFLAAIETPYLFEDFSQYTYGSYVANSLILAESGYIGALFANSKLYSGDGNMSTKCVNDILTIDFANSPFPVTAIGGYFWPTDIRGNNLVGYTKVVLSDGVVYEINRSDYSSFLGLISADSSAFSRLEISVLGRIDTPYSWPTVDNLYVGTARNLAGVDKDLIPYPEPSSVLLLGTGLCGICIFLRRRRK
jgi:hypothetical protein